jgi:hypothetical protein
MNRKLTACGLAFVCFLPHASPAWAGARLPDGTRIAVRTMEQLSSATLKDGSQVTFAVVEDVVVDGEVVIRQGTPVRGTIVDAQAKRRMGRAGKLQYTVRGRRGRPRLVVFHLSLELPARIVGPTEPLAVHGSMPAQTCDRQCGHVFAEGLSAHGPHESGNRPQRFIRREFGPRDPWCVDQQGWCDRGDDRRSSQQLLASASEGSERRPVSGVRRQTSQRKYACAVGSDLQLIVGPPEGGPHDRPLGDRLFLARFAHVEILHLPL